MLAKNESQLTIYTKERSMDSIYNDDEDELYFNEHFIPHYYFYLTSKNNHIRDGASSFCSEYSLNTNRNIANGASIYWCTSLQRR